MTMIGLVEGLLGDLEIFTNRTELYWPKYKREPRYSARCLDSKETESLKTTPTKGFIVNSCTNSNDTYM
jgi:hypothetical protein